jgi:hypothetical protein
VHRPKVLLGASAAGLLTATFASGLAGGCVSGAVAIAECREIESARCEASVPCGVIEDVDECQRFYRDQCLHGILGPKAPTAQEQDACVAAITGAGQCAEEDPDGPLDRCAPEGAGGLGGQGSLTEDSTVCEFLAAPWEADVCNFLNEPPAEGGASG